MKRALGTIDGAAPLLVALVTVALAMMALHTCDPVEVDEHEQGFIGYLAKEPATFPSIIAGDRCDLGFSLKLHGLVELGEPNS